jgi:thymidine kinase
MGPMYSGKTTSLIQQYHNQTNINKIIIDYNIQSISKTNNEYWVYNSNMETHDGIIAPSVYKCKHLDSLKDENNYQIYSKETLDYYYKCFAHAEHVYINECQFFPDLKNFVLELLKLNINVYLFGLDGDYKQKMMGQTFELIPFASKIKKLQGKCSKCNKNSVISHRITNDTQVYLPDETVYIPLCLSCYNY